MRDTPAPTRRRTFSADERLRAYQHNHEIEPTRLNGHAKRGSFAEYSYDALGRRIQVRTRRDGLCYAGPNASTVDCSSGIERYVWSGDNILWEMRGPGGNTATPEQLNQVSGSGVEYGTVGYTHAGGVDRPLVAWKGSSTVVVPHLNWRGLFGKGTDANGYPSGADIEWPGFQTTASHSRAPTQQPTVTWFGSVLEGQRDAGGQMYMRNRYYDPATGQFTQTDPIGLGGGLNTYGFANGDPVSYSDPYGLSSTSCCPNDANPRQVELEVQRAQSGDESLMAIGELVRGRRVRATIARHEKTIASAAATNGVDAALIKGIIFEEQTHQFPGEAALEARGAGSTVGLGQMTVGAHGTRQQLLNPTYNINAMGRHLGTLSGEGLIDPARPVASLATRYNCGSCTSISPYGERVEKFHKQFSSP